MKKALIQLFIITLWSWSTIVALIVTTNPFIHNGEANNLLVGLFVALFFIATTLLAALIISIIKNYLPAHKLPHLLIKDSLIQGSTFGFGLSGLLVLQLLRAATPVNIILWLAIISAIAWIVHELLDHSASSENSMQTPSVREIKSRRR